MVVEFYECNAEMALIQHLAEADLWLQLTNERACEYIPQMMSHVTITTNSFTSGAVANWQAELDTVPQSHN